MILKQNLKGSIGQVKHTNFSKKKVETCKIKSDCLGNVYVESNLV